jgi:class 3 adenylate cyclase
MPEEERPQAAPWPELSRVRRAVAVVDVLESVRLMLQHENSVIERWRRFLREVRDEVLPATGGRLVKSLGDGLLVELPNVRCAVQAVLEMHHRIAAYNAGVVAGAALSLRAGVHEAEIVVDELDVYGAGVNLAARLAALAGPGETVVSPEARDALVDGLDVEIEDLGECFMKNVNHAQRAFRVGPAGRAPVVWSPASAGGDERPSIAVLPFSGGDDAGQAATCPRCARCSAAGTSCTAAASARGATASACACSCSTGAAGRCCGPTPLLSKTCEHRHRACDLTRV